MGNTGPSPPRARPGPRNAGYRLWWYLGVAWLLGGSAGCRLLAERGPTETRVGHVSGTVAGGRCMHAAR